MIHLERAQQLAAGDQRNRPVGLEALACEQGSASKLRKGAQRCQGFDPPAGQSPAGQALIDGEPVIGHRGGQETGARRQREHVVRLLQQQDVRRIHLQLRGHLVEDDLEREPEVRACAQSQAQALQ